jgi:hypothetical protein
MLSGVFSRSMHSLATCTCAPSAPTAAPFCGLLPCPLRLAILLRGTRFTALAGYRGERTYRAFRYLIGACSIAYMPALSLVHSALWAYYQLRQSPPWARAGTALLL